jgi:hypothetical protein
MLKNSRNKQNGTDLCYLLTINESRVPKNLGGGGYISKARHVYSCQKQNAAIEMHTFVNGTIK